MYITILNSDNLICICPSKASSAIEYQNTHLKWPAWFVRISNPALGELAAVWERIDSQHSQCQVQNNKILLHCKKEYCTARNTATGDENESDCCAGARNRSRLLSARISSGRRCLFYSFRPLVFWMHSLSYGKRPSLVLELNIWPQKITHQCWPPTACR